MLINLAINRALWSIKAIGELFKVICNWSLPDFINLHSRGIHKTRFEKLAHPIAPKEILNFFFMLRLSYNETRKNKQVSSIKCSNYRKVFGSNVQIIEKSLVQNHFHFNDNLPGGREAQ